MSEKTEEPTPRRLRKALEEGDSGASAALAQALAFVVAVALAPAAFGALGTWAASALRGALSRSRNAGPLPSAAEIAWSIAVPVLELSLPLLLAVALTSAVFSAIQAGGVIAFKRLSPDLERLDPIRGVKGLFSFVRMFSVFRSLIGAGAVAALAFGDLREHAADFARVAGRLSFAGPLAITIALSIAKWAVVVGLVLGVIDLVVTRRAWLKRLRMSKDEVKREHKESEGDPEIRAARDRAHQEVLAAASAAAVKGATVVVINPTHLACALRYATGDDGEDADEAPVILASGEGYVAEQIRRAARDYGVPIVQNVPLAHALRELEVGTSIPEALYEAVAEVLQAILAQESAE